MLSFSTVQRIPRDMGLTKEQRQRVEENRARAQARLREKRIKQTSAGPETEEPKQGGNNGTGVAAAAVALAVGDALEGVSSSSGTAPAPDSGSGTLAKESAAAAHRRDPDEGRGERPRKRSAPARAVGQERKGGNPPGTRSTRMGGGGGGHSSPGCRRNGGSSRGGKQEAAAAPEIACEECAGAADDARIDKELLEGFGVSVCRTCKMKVADFQFITKKEAKDVYLLPEGTLAVLKFIERENPHHSSWTKMKLFLRRDVAAYSHKRWGSDAGLAAERNRRDSLKFERTLAKTKGVFKRSRPETEDDGVGRGFL